MTSEKFRIMLIRERMKRLEERGLEDTERYYELDNELHQLVTEKAS